MSDNLIQNIAVHAEKDLEQGVLRIYADVLGQLVPIAAEKLGTLGTHESSPGNESGGSTDSGAPAQQ